MVQIQSKSWLIGAQFLRGLLLFSLDVDSPIIRCLRHQDYHSTEIAATKY